MFNKEELERYFNKLAEELGMEGIEGLNEFTKIMDSMKDKLEDPEEFAKALNDENSPLYTIMDKFKNINNMMQDTFNLANIYINSKIRYILSFLDSMGEDVSYICIPMCTTMYLTFNSPIKNRSLYVNLFREFDNSGDITIDTKNLCVFLYPKTPDDIKKIFDSILSSN